MISVCVCVSDTHREALSDGDLDVEEQHAGLEAGAGSDRLLGVAEDTAHTGWNTHTHTLV